MQIYNGNWTVYIHKNKINGKMYVGITCQDTNRRWGNGSNYKTCRKFYNAIQKYGWQNFEHIIFAQNLTMEEASNMQQLLIKQLDTINNGYNLNFGGIVQLHCCETKQKISNSVKKFYNSQRGLQKRKIKPLWNDENRAVAREKAKDRFIEVYCIQLDKIYECIADASRQTGLSRSAIRRSCKRSGDKIKDGHLHFRYLNNIQKPNDQSKDVGSSEPKQQLPNVG